MAPNGAPRSVACCAPRLLENYDTEVYRVACLRPSWPRVINLRQDPYERFAFESQMYLRWMADKMWLMVPSQALVAKHLESLKEFPPTGGSSLSIDAVLQSLKTQQQRQ